jgi:putative transposase
MLGAARRRECPRQRELPEDLVTNIEGWAERVGAELAAKAFGVAPRTWRHHAQKQRGELPERPSRATGKPRRPHPAKLTDEEEQEVVDTLCSEEFVDVGVDEVFVTILDDGIYLCSPSTMHRILRDRGLNGQRRQGNPRQGHPRPRVVATAPNMVWVWDISRIPGPAKGVWFYLYLVMDLWSRKAVGWCVDIEETAAIAEKLIATIAAREGIERHQLEVHSDRGAQMTSGTLAELYDTLGVRRSLSRPRVSNDNPHAEAAFKTLKYRPDWPTTFETLAEVTAHCEQFFGWYNNEHHHSGIGMLTPADRHSGHGQRIDIARQAVLDAAFQAHPERFPNGRPHPPHQPERVWINPTELHTR